MTSLRSISTLLVLGTLLLPPHWCCAFEPSAEVDSGAELRPCCLEREQSAPAAKVAERKGSCCAGRDSQRDDERRESSAGGESLSDGAPVDTTLCPYCLPRVAPKAEVAAFALELPLLTVGGVQLPVFCESGATAVFAVGSFIPISSDLLARHCRWNC